MLCLGVWPTWRLLLFPIFLCPALLAAIGIGLWTSAINVTYRDMRFVLPLFIQLAFFISPVAYTMDIVPPNWRVFFSVNPLIAVLDGCRWSVLGDAFAVSPALLLYSYAASLAVLAGGVAFFRRAERLFADVI
jgi:lipopolysaccharide transport system permease protein